jgi:hypothetical protein
VERLSDELCFDGRVRTEGVIRGSGTSIDHARPVLAPIISRENRAGYAESATTLKSSPMGTDSTIFSAPGNWLIDDIVATTCAETA